MSKDHQVKAKKHLGQHFLTDESVAERIANTLSLEGYKKVYQNDLVSNIMIYYKNYEQILVHVSAMV